jgi:enolase
VEDGLEENDFKGFKELLKKVKKIPSKSLIVGDDLTTTNPKRLLKAIKNKSINAIIVKPNQIGSLLKVKEVIDIAKEHNVKTIISHRSGESMDNTIADLGVGFGVDYIKTGIYGKVRRSKLKRLMKIEKKLSRKK